jgi:hypothetical protein
MPHQYWAVVGWGGAQTFHSFIIQILLRILGLTELVIRSRVCSIHQDALGVRAIELADAVGGIHEFLPFCGRFKEFTKESWGLRSW